VASPAARPEEALPLVAGGALIAALLVYHRAERRLGERRRQSEQSFTRILQGLSRSVSVDAVVEAIVEELRTASGADHIVVARLRPHERVLEATLVSASASTAASTTRLPADLLDARTLAELADGDGPEGPALESPVPVMAGTTAAPAPATARGVTAAPTHDTGSDADAEVRPAPRPRALPARSAGRATPRAVADRVAERVRMAYGLRHTLAEPLLAGSSPVGALVLSRRTADPWPIASRRLLASAAQEVSAALARAYAHQAAETRASIDGLTGLPNRRHFDELAAVLGRGRRQTDALGILMIDIDHFKRLNDRHGHATGDAVLRAVAGAIVATVRAEDTPARYGGEEFVVVLRQAAHEQVVEVAERIRHAVAALRPDELGIIEPVTVSVGVAVADGSGATVADLVKRADRALYAAKRRGRDQVVVD
jgi:diguanylate cyclase (GGDEF)-like protein